MDGSRGYHIKWSKSDRKRQISWYHLYLESKKLFLIQMNNYKIETDLQT